MMSYRIALRAPAALLLACALPTLGCGIPEDEPPAVGSTESAILNGLDDKTHRAVVKFGGCTGTFIAPQLILTATHCLPECKGSEVGCFVKQSNPLAWVGRDGPYTSTAYDAFKLSCTAAQKLTDPDCQGESYPIDYVHFPRPTASIVDPPDVAILHTTKRFTGAPIPMLEPELMPSSATIFIFTNQVLEMVGYSNNKNADDTRRRRGTATVVGEDTHSWNKQRAFRVDGSPAPTQGICPGDSGGPALFSLLENGKVVQRVGGAVSEGACTSGGTYGYVPAAFTKRVFAVDHSAHLGCFKDGASRDLPVFAACDGQMTPARCVTACRDRGYRYAGLQYGGECRCGNSYGKHGQLAASSCSKACTGDSQQKCGGTWANSVYAISRGCFKDSGNRDLPLLAAYDSGMTVPRCIGLCKAKGYPYAGLQYGGQCYCGSSYGKHGQSHRCTTPCTGDTSQTCGGRWANDVF